MMSGDLIPEEASEAFEEARARALTGPTASLANYRGLQAAAPLILAAANEPHRSVVTAEEVTFRGCDSNNADLCNCGSWEPPTCDACDEELIPGDEVFFTQLQSLPWLPAEHRDQEVANWLWHVKCDQRRASVLRGEGDRNA